jgi:hypothetical protein
MTERETRIDDMNDCKTGFISGVNPFLPEDRDITVPVTRCNGLCHVTQTLSRHMPQRARRSLRRSCSCSSQRDPAESNRRLEFVQ